MPKVVMLVGMASADWSYTPGDEVEVKEEVAKAWVKNGLAKVVEEAQKKKPTKGSDK